MDASSVLSDDDYDVVSNPGQRSLESSMTDFGHIPAQTIHEPPPSHVARDKFDSVSWTAKEIQAYVHRALGVSNSAQASESSVNDRTKRVYVDGIFDGFNAGNALQLRQAKLSFPSVYLIVGVYPDEQLQRHEYLTSFPHVERCEVVRHCRWVDEVISDAPWVLDSQFINDNRIDYVAIDEGTSVDPGCDKARLKGYDAMKSLRIVVPTRRTTGLATVLHVQPTTPLVPVTPVPEDYPQVDVYGIGY
ncbi:hypothetical protein D9615_003498 [Tricholomella constricta]|uniref:choline-phosphate cytidylyltransferase n=1 Tax=Tricholomella constricta TaxID=117010 RepID=A0A8H5HHT0_9AGAR|nr:hypothetical protein D9615_003498 [Tricholomella constricta]